MFSVFKSIKNWSQNKVQNRTPFRNPIFSVFLPLGPFQEAFLRDVCDFLGILGALPGVQKTLQPVKKRKNNFGVAPFLLFEDWLVTCTYVLIVSGSLGSLWAWFLEGFSMKRNAFRTEFSVGSGSHKGGPAVIPPRGSSIK